MAGNVRDVVRRLLERSGRAQGSFEYLLLLSGVLLIVVLITVFLRGTISQVESGTGASLEGTLAAWNLFTNISLVNVTNPTPIPGTVNIGGSGGTGTSSGGSAPGATVTACRDGTRANSCVRGFEPLYCTGQGDYVDKCGTCGCPAGLSCDAATNKCGSGGATPTPAAEQATPTPAPTPAARGGADLALAGLARAFDGLVQGFTGIYTGFFSFFREGGRVVFALIAVGLAGIVALVAYGLVKKKRL